MKINFLCCYIALSMLKDVKVCKRQGKGVSGKCVMAVYGGARCSEQCWSGLSLTDTPTPATTTQCYHLSSSVIHTFREDFTTWSIKYHHHSSVAVNMSSLAWLTLQPQEMVTYFIKARNDISMEPNKVVDEIVSESWPFAFQGDNSHLWIFYPKLEIPCRQHLSGPFLCQNLLFLQISINKSFLSLLVQCKLWKNVNVNEFCWKKILIFANWKQSLMHPINGSCVIEKADLRVKIVEWQMMLEGRLDLKILWVPAIQPMFPPVPATLPCWPIEYHNLALLILNTKKN